MVKKIVSLIMFSLLSITLLSTKVVQAYSPDTPSIIDEVKILKSNENEDIIKYLLKIESKYDTAVYILIIDKNIGRDIRRFADESLAERIGYDRDGLLLLVNYYDRQIWLTYSGKVIDIVDDQRRDQLLKILRENLKQEPNSAFKMFLSELEKYFNSGVKAGQYRVKEKSLNMIDFLIALAASSIFFMLYFIFTKKRYSTKYKKYVYSVEEKNALVNISNNVTLIDTFRTVTYIPRSESKSSSTSPKSTTHKSNGGTFGGGGTSF